MFTNVEVAVSVHTRTVGIHSCVLCYCLKIAPTVVRGYVKQSTAELQDKVEQTMLVFFSYLIFFSPENESYSILPVGQSQILPSL